MRLIGNVETRQQAERLSAYLVTQDISTHFEADNELWQIWVRDEDQVDPAREFLEEFRQDPEASQYRQAVDEAQRIAREKEKQLQDARANQVHMTSDRWNAPIHKVAPLTVALVAISVVVSLFLTNFGKLSDSATFRALAVASLTNDQAEAIAENSPQGLHSYNTRLRMGSLARGEVWRAVTPIFLHFDVFHLLFNMIWLVYLGRQIEYRYGTRWMAFLVLAIAVPSNIAGCLVPENLDGVGIAPLGTHWTILAGGMSGVVYGLFGYIWMKIIFDPKSGLFISMTNTAIMLIWLVACMHPAFPINVGNWAHGIGLVTGLIIGYFPKLVSDVGLGNRTDP